MAEGKDGVRSVANEAPLVATLEQPRRATCRRSADQLYVRAIKPSWRANELWSEPLSLRRRTANVPGRPRLANLKPGPRGAAARRALASVRYLSSRPFRFSGRGLPPLWQRGQCTRVPNRLSNCLELSEALEAPCSNKIPRLVAVEKATLATGRSWKWY